MALPIIVLVLLQLLFALGREREEIERRTLAQAEQVSTLSMARLDADFALMRVLATADVFEQRRWTEARERATEVRTLNPHWRNVIVSDLTAGEEVFDLLTPQRRAPLQRAVTAASALEGPSVSGAVREGPGCPCVFLHLPISRGSQRYLLSVALDPAVFRTILLNQAPNDGIAALVDEQGLFIARTAEHESRIGTPATRFVREAIASGADSGVYAGTTFEGFKNYTAFHRIQGVGWSTHVAVASALIDRPRTFSWVAIAVGALLGIALTAAMVAYAMREFNERRSAEARLAQTQKLEAIGHLTGGVAHDFNNLLTVIIGGLNMLMRRMDDAKQREIAEHMMESAQRGAKLTKQLLAFSRGQQLALSSVDLNALGPGMEELLRRSIGPGITLAFDLDTSARWVRTDANQLELAILNLVINARDAMPDGGRITISSHPGARPDTIELSVSDNGLGMPKNIADRALEPFFTTKPAGKGTGLGLSQVFGAARQSGGQVEIDTALGRGTKVTLILPRAAPPAEPEPANESAEATPASGSGARVLVVDDEPGVRTFMADALREAGYHAIEAEDVGVALRLLESDPPDLLLTDYSMPGMTGLELAERARARDERLRILIVSGYADAMAIEASAARPTLLRKPFDERVLLNAVRDVLAA